MIAALALELLILGLAVWQLAALRRSMRADRERAEREDKEGGP